MNAYTQRMRERCFDAVNALTLAEAKITLLEKELEAAVGSAQSMSDTLSAAEERFVQLTAERDHLSSSLQRLRMELDAAEASNRDVRKRLTEAERERDEARSEAAVAAQSYYPPDEDGDDSSSAAAEENKRLHADCARLGAALAAAQNELEAARSSSRGRGRKQAENFTS